VVNARQLRAFEARTKFSSSRFWNDPVRVARVTGRSGGQSEQLKLRLGAHVGADELGFVSAGLEHSPDLERLSVKHDE
jgi:hypothetical protein